MIIMFSDCDRLSPEILLMEKYISPVCEVDYQLVYIPLYHKGMNKVDQNSRKLVVFG